jgi:hypothetical protein
MGKTIQKKCGEHTYPKPADFHWIATDLRNERGIGGFSLHFGILKRRALHVMRSAQSAEKNFTWSTLNELGDPSRPEVEPSLILVC